MERCAGAALALALLTGCQRPPAQESTPEPPPTVRTYPPGGTAPGATARDDAELRVVFQWRLKLARTGRPARESAVGYVRADGSPGGVILINGEGAVIQPIPGTLGPDAAAVARRWLEARGWALAGG